MAERPGILFRFELLDALEQLEPADAGTLFVSAMRYGRYGDTPIFQNPVVSVIWPFVKSAVDRDAESYDNKTAQRRYAVYVREEKKNGEPRCPSMNGKHRLISKAIGRCPRLIPITILNYNLNLKLEYNLILKSQYIMMGRTSRPHPSEKSLVNLAG